MPDRPLETELEDLRQENRLLHERLEDIEKRSERAQKVRWTLLRGGFRLLLPLLDRQKVVRSFGALAETVSAYSGERSQWPSRDEVLLKTRGFLESIVRFLIRRHTVVLLFSLLATVVPGLQIWLFFQQNEIIENQTRFAEVQLFDVVARSMTEGDRNARTITGALLANASLDFLHNVVTEAFDPGSFSLYRREGLQAAARRAQDTGFRGNLIRGVVRVVDKRLETGESPSALLTKVRPMFVKVLQDSEYRLPEVVRTGRDDTDVQGPLIEEVDAYIGQTGALLKKYGRLARSAGRSAEYYADVRPLLARMSKMSSSKDSVFASTYRVVMEDFLLEVADESSLSSGPIRLENRDPKAVVKGGIDKLEAIYGPTALDWPRFRQQVGN
jgi:hypothetical protein